MPCCNRVKKICATTGLSVLDGTSLSTIEDSVTPWYTLKPRAFKLLIIFGVRWLCISSKDSLTIVDAGVSTFFWNESGYKNPSNDDPAGMYFNTDKLVYVLGLNAWSISELL